MLDDLTAECFLTSEELETSMLRQIEETVRRSFEMESLGIAESPNLAGMSKNAKRPESLWTPLEKEIDDRIKLVRGKNPEHYVASIPWKDKVPNFRNNLKAVIKRQEKTNSSKYLESKGTSIAEIDAKFQDHLKKGYIEEVTDEASINDEKAYYLSYFPVVRRDKETTSMRIVFDAASIDRYTMSLNSEIAKTVNRLNCLLTILVQHRKYKYAVSADISEMFLRVRLNPEDRKYHRFWWNGKIWQWTRILFGNRSSPDISQKVLTEHAKSQKLQYPNAAEAVIHFMYMDDVIKSVETDEECCTLVRELPPLLKGCDMVIQKFYSNSKVALKTLPKELLSKKVKFEDKEEILEEMKVLGMTWDAESDLYRYHSKYKDCSTFFEKMGFSKDQVWTKRLILKLSATVFDPLGLLCPFTIRSRSILQSLWTEKLDWDTPVPAQYQKDWSKWLNDMFELSTIIKVPRWLSITKAKRFQIHVFCDASTKAFAACVYVRVVEEQDSSKREKVECHLVVAKARVTPVKAETVSRLELAACVIGARLGCFAARALGLNAEDNFYWTDSSNCLHWINTTANSLKTYASNRVGEIQTITQISQWRHVDTAANPADIPTRFPNIHDLAKNTLWWKGPDFLLKPDSEWAKPFEPGSGKTSDEFLREFKKRILSDANNLADAILVAQEKKRVLSFPRKFSPFNAENYSVGELWDGFEKLLRGKTTLMSILFKGKPYSECRKIAFRKLAREEQRKNPAMMEVIEAVQKGTEEVLPKDFRSLLPFVNTFGVLCSHSRLAAISHLSQETRFPIILSSKMKFTELLVQSYHRKFGHPVGKQMVKSKLKAKFHIIGLENLLRQVQAECLTCKKEKAQPLRQRIADLPAFRFERPLKAFSKVGLDFAGPFEVKFHKGRARIKSYILVITCLQTRAVHLEATEGQDLDSVMNALSRFVSYRGMPNVIYSDNFKTFVSQHKELQNWVRNIDTGSVIKRVEAEVSWLFTPPRAPHFGGIYEIMVKATKRCLKALYNYTDLDMDQFRTAVISVSSMLNTRPLTRVKMDNSETITLTPNHFLHGSAGGAISTSTLPTVKTHWQEVVRAVDEAWKVYIHEYITELRTAKIWQRIMPSVKVGDLVLELDPNTPRGTWRMAEIVKVIPSPDGLIRKVTIRAPNALDERGLDRAIHQLCPLNINIRSDEDYQPKCKALLAIAYRAEETMFSPI